VRVVIVRQQGEEAEPVVMLGSQPYPIDLEEMIAVADTREHQL